MNNQGGFFFYNVIKQVKFVNPPEDERNYPEKHGS
jgi:hypothetical protein